MHSGKRLINTFVLLCGRDFVPVQLNISKLNGAQPAGGYRTIRTGTFA